jgi:hypothetical protein
LVGRPEVKRSLGRPRRKWDSNINMDRRKTDLEGVDWIHLAQDRDEWWAPANPVKTFGSIKGGGFLDWLRALVASEEGLCSI